MENLLYLIRVWGDVEPEIFGPFDSYEERDQKTGELRSENEGGIYKLYIDPGGNPEVYSYSGDEMEEILEANKNEPKP